MTALLKQQVYIHARQLIPFVERMGETFYVAKNLVQYAGGGN